MHGFGLATKLQELTLSPEGLVGNIIAFNVGVEIGQLLALIGLLFVINAWRAAGSFERYASAFNFVLMFAGFMLAAYQLAGYFLADPGEDAEGYPDQYFIRYEEGEEGENAGSLVAPFDGNHGWYWLNIEDYPIEITLEVHGFYDHIEELGRSYQ